MNLGEGRTAPAKAHGPKEAETVLKEGCFSKQGGQSTGTGKKTKLKKAGRAAKPKDTVQSQDTQKGRDQTWSRRGCGRDFVRFCVLFNSLMLFKRKFYS